MTYKLSKTSILTQTNFDIAACDAKSSNLRWWRNCVTNFVFSTQKMRKRYIIGACWGMERAGYTPMRYLYLINSFIMGGTLWCCFTNCLYRLWEDGDATSASCLIYIMYIYIWSGWNVCHPSLLLTLQTVLVINNMDLGLLHYCVVGLENSHGRCSNKKSVGKYKFMQRLHVCITYIYYNLF